GLTPVARAADQNQYWDNDEVTVQIHEDSTFDVTERQGFVFDSGTFHGSYRDIETNRLTGITNVSVSEDGVGAYQTDNTPIDLKAGKYGPPRTFQVLDQSGSKRIIWFYGTLDAPAHKTMVIKYTVSGGLRFYPDGDQFYWSPFMPNRTAVIERASITVQVPPNIDLTTGPARQWAVYPANAATVQVSPQQAVFTVKGALQPNTDFEAGLQWAHGAIAGTAAPWQIAADQGHDRQGWATLIVVVLSLLVGIGGPLFWLGRWYGWGRDPVSGPVAGNLPAPPSDLPAGLVGTLVDEQAKPRDVIAAVLDLGRQGHLRIEQVKPRDVIGVPRAWTDFSYTLLNRDVRYTHERLVLDLLFGQKLTEIRLSQLSHFHLKLPQVYSAMYQDLLDLKYFTSRPDTTRNRYNQAALWLLGLAVLSGVFTPLGLALTPMFWLLPVACAVAAGAGFIAAGKMPRKTVRGADQAARWRAFGRYLGDLQQFGDLGNAAQRFGDYLPYAVALGLGGKYIDQFNAAQTPPALPTYYQPRNRLDTVDIPNVNRSSRAGAGLGNGISIGGGSSSGGRGLDLSPSGANALNQGIALSLTNFNTNLTGMINNTSNVLGLGHPLGPGPGDGADTVGAVLNVAGAVLDVVAGGGGGGGGGGSF
ncbi:MAG TPA: DUF2207 domain-containing protein, partial [Chloroflexia bacterium]